MKLFNTKEYQKMFEGLKGEQTIEQLHYIAMIEKLDLYKIRIYFKNHPDKGSYVQELCVTSLFITQLRQRLSELSLYFGIESEIHFLDVDCVFRFQEREFGELQLRKCEIASDLDNYREL
jgi:hypothetical protein